MIVIVETYYVKSVSSCTYNGWNVNSIKVQGSAFTLAMHHRQTELIDEGA